MQYSTIFKLYKPQLKIARIDIAVEYSTIFKLYKPQHVRRVFDPAR